jgi:hypothetical protein
VKELTYTLGHNKRLKFLISNLMNILSSFPDSFDEQKSERGYFFIDANCIFNVEKEKFCMFVALDIM